MTVLGYSPKLKRGMGLAFGAHFLHDFSIKKHSLFNALSMGKVSMSHLFSSQDIENMLLSSYLDS